MVLPFAQKKTSRIARILQDKNGVKVLLLLGLLVERNKPVRTGVDKECVLADRTDCHTFAGSNNKGSVGVVLTL